MGKGLYFKRRKKVKKPKTVEEAVKRFEERVRGAKEDYKDRTETGFRENWVTWYDYTMFKLLSEYDTLVDMDPYDRAYQVQEIVSEASKDYRKARIIMDAMKAKAELVEAKDKIEKLIGMTLAEILT